MRKIAVVLCLSVFLPSAWPKEETYEPVTVEQGEFCLVVPEIPKNTSPGESIRLNCHVGWDCKPLELRMKLIQELVGKLDDEDFDLRCDAERKLFESLRSLSLEQSREILESIEKKCDVLETQQRIDSVIRKKAADIEPNENAALDPPLEMIGCISWEIATPPARPDKAPIPMRRANEQVWCNPFIAGGPSILRRGNEMDLYVFAAMDFPPGEYLFRVRFSDGKYFNANASPVELSTPWLRIRISPRKLKKFPELQNALPTGWCAMSNYSCALDDDGRFKNEPYLPGWTLSGPLDLEKALRTEPTGFTRAYTVELADTQTWHRPTEIRNGYYFESKATLYIFPLDYECVADTHYPNLPAVFLGATPKGQFYATAEGQNADALLMALKKYCAENAMKPVRAPRRLGDLSIRLANRRNKAVLLEWLIQASSDDQARLLRHSEIIRCIREEVTELSEVLELWAADSAKRWLIESVLWIGAEKYEDLLLRMVTHPDNEVRSMAARLLAGLMCTPDSTLRKSHALAVLIEERADKETNPYVLNLLLDIAAQHEELAKGCVPALAQNALETSNSQEGSGWGEPWARLGKILEGQKTWERYKDFCSDCVEVQGAVRWWKEQGSAQSWPQTPWLSRLVLRIQESKAVDRRRELGSR